MHSECTLPVRQLHLSRRGGKTDLEELSSEAARFAESWKVYTRDVCCPCALLTGVSSTLLSLMTFLRVLTEKSHNWTPKANVLLVKLVNSPALRTAAAVAVHPGALPRRHRCLHRLHTEPR